VQVQPHFAPLILFPLLVGLSLGASLVVGLRVCSWAHSPTVYVGMLLAALLAVVGQHFWSYRVAVAAWVNEQPVRIKVEQAFPDISKRLQPSPPADPLLTEDESFSVTAFAAPGPGFGGDWREFWS
jgi:hypothetical protein